MGGVGIDSAEKVVVIIGREKKLMAENCFFGVSFCCLFFTQCTSGGDSNTNRSHLWWDENSVMGHRVAWVQLTM